MRQIISGERIKLNRNELFVVECCDCGLCHGFISNKDVFIKIYRDDALTKIVRKKRNKKRYRKSL
jgi:hypothetical protein